MPNEGPTSSLDDVAWPALKPVRGVPAEGRRGRLLVSVDVAATRSERDEGQLDKLVGFGQAVAGQRLVRVDAFAPALQVVVVLRLEVSVQVAGHDREIARVLAIHDPVAAHHVASTQTNQADLQALVSLDGVAGQARHRPDV